MASEEFQLVTPATSRAPARPWTAEEDTLLRAAVAAHGDDTDNWKIIAEAVPGRTNKACRKRWKHSLSPTLKKTAWTKEEDDLLVKLHAEFPCKWSMIAKQISGRTDDACAKRYREALDPAIKQGDWTPEEDERLLQEYRRWGGRWASVAQQLGRSGLGCRNRWRLLERKKNSSSSRSVPRKRLAPSEDDNDGNDSELLDLQHATMSASPSSSSSSDVQGPSSWSTQLLAQFHYNPLQFEDAFFGEAQQIDYPFAIDPTLIAESQPSQIPAHFDPRLWDIMQGGCGCGCGSGGVCGCNEETSAPFTDLSSQDFLGPFHQMSQAFGQVEGPQPYPQSYIGNEPPVSSVPQPLANAMPPSQEALVTLLGRASPYPEPTSQPNHHQYPHPDLSLPSFPPLPPHHAHEKVDQLPTPSQSTHPAVPPASHVHPHNSHPPQPQSYPEFLDLPPSVLLNDPIKWAAVIARAKQASSCRCSGVCCNVSSDTGSSETKAPGSCCGGGAKVAGVKRPSPEASLSNAASTSASAPPLANRPAKKSKREKDISPTPSGSSIPRLSSILSADELPYACGEPGCWVIETVNPANGTEQVSIRSRYGTSGELLEHWRKVHGDGLTSVAAAGAGGINGMGGSLAPEGKVFRCALEGCGKGWKSINGIQYHLQLSKAHFSVALNKQVLQSSTSGDSISSTSSCCGGGEGSAASGPSSEEGGLGDKKKKMFPCPVPNCPNVYKQAAGLKYHLAHGHPQKAPTQLGAVPPALAIKMEEKVRKTSV